MIRQENNLPFVNLWATEGAKPHHVGIGYRESLVPMILENSEHIDFLEIIADTYIHFPNKLKQLEKMAEQYRLIAHGVDLSIASPFSVDADYLQKLKRISEISKTIYYSDHLCMTKAPGIMIGQLSPVQWSESLLKIVIDKVNQVQDYLGRPLVLENISYLVDLPNSDLTQTEFFSRLVTATQCGMLIDVTNIFINAVNHKFNPVKFIEQLPLRNIAQVHLAGGHWFGKRLIDSHAHPIQEGSWQLLRDLASRTLIPSVVIEYDSNYPSNDQLLSELVTAKKIITPDGELSPKPLTESNPRT